MAGARILHDVSVVIPTFNAERFIGDALASVVEQSAYPKEIVIVDDASRDSTVEVVQHFATTSPISVRLLTLTHNSGSPSRPLNTGIAAAEGNLIAVLDQDDVFLPDKLLIESSALRSFPELAIAGSCSAAFNCPETRLQSIELLAAIFPSDGNATQPAYVSGRKFLQLLLVHGCFPIGFPGFMFRKPDWHAKSGIDESLRIADHDFLCRLATRGGAAFVPTINYLRRIHDCNLSTNRLLVGRDYVSVLRRYLAADVLSTLELSSSNKIYDTLLGIAYMMRDAGRYPDAIKAVQCASSTMGWRNDLLKFTLSLPFHLTQTKCLQLLRRTIITSGLS
jgi:glycosyltransferase involved in cell wall biosynthesis